MACAPPWFSWLLILLLLFFWSCFGLDARRLFFSLAMSLRQSCRLLCAASAWPSPLGPSACRSHSPLPCRAVRLSPDAPPNPTTAVSFLAGAAGDVWAREARPSILCDGGRYGVPHWRLRPAGPTGSKKIGEWEVLAVGFCWSGPSAETAVLGAAGLDSIGNATNWRTPRALLGRTWLEALFLSWHPAVVMVQPHVTLLQAMDHGAAAGRI